MRTLALPVRSHPPRRAFTLVEATISLAALFGAAILVAEMAVWSLGERARTEARMEALDAADNVLEQARAVRWKELSSEWASAQQLPEPLTKRWPDCRLTVRVEPVEKRPLVKQVTVEIKWTDKGRIAWTPINLTALLAARAEEKKP